MPDHGRDPVVLVVQAAVVPEPASVHAAPMAVAVVAKLKHLGKNGQMLTALMVMGGVLVVLHSRWVYSW